MRFQSLFKYVLCAAFGGGVGYLIADYAYGHYFEKKMLEYVEEESDVEEYDAEVIKAEKENEPDEWIPEEPIQTKKTKKKKKPVNYNAITGVPSKPDLTEMITELTLTNKDTKTSYISEEEYSRRNPDYVSDELSYYENDDVLVDSEENIIQFPENILGNDEVLSNFGYLSGDPDIVYLRNDETHTQYEIARIHGSYNEMVLGYPAEEPKKIKKIKTKKGDE